MITIGIEIALRLYFHVFQGLLASTKDHELREVEASLHRCRQDAMYQSELLRYLVQDQVDIELGDYLPFDQGTLYYSPHFEDNFKIKHIITEYLKESGRLCCN